MRPLGTASGFHDDLSALLNLVRRGGGAQNSASVWYWALGRVAAVRVRRQCRRGRGFVSEPKAFPGGAVAQVYPPA